MSLSIVERKCCRCGKSRVAGQLTPLEIVTLFDCGYRLDGPEADANAIRRAFEEGSSESRWVYLIVPK